MTNPPFDPAIALRARIVGEWSNRHLMEFGPLLPSAEMDALRILGAHNGVGAWVLRRLLFLIHQEHKSMLDAPSIITAPGVPVTLKGMTAALVAGIMDQDGGSDLLPVDAEHDPENWDAIRSARLFIEHGV